MNNNKLNPWFITGISDGDSNFYVGIYQGRSRVGWRVEPSYRLTAGNNPANKILLDQVRLFFGGIGSITVTNSNNSLNYTVTGLQNCLIIREHFITYPLLTYKLVYFTSWSSILDIMLTGAHLNLAGLLQIVAYKAHFKLGLSEMLIAAFPDYVPVPLFDYNPNLALMNIHWISGFINADGSFSVLISSSTNSLLGETVKLRIDITQHEISLLALQRAAEILACGSIYRKGKAAVSWGVFNIKDITRLITDFNENGVQILGAKALDYADFCKAVSLISSKKHLTREGLNSIRSLSAGMNSTRTDFGSE